MERFFTLRYYFTPLPDPYFPFTKVVLILVLLLVAAGFALLWYRRKCKDEVFKRLTRRLPRLFWTYGVLLGLLLFFREAGLSLLAMRLWWFLLLLHFVYTAVKTGLTLPREYRERKAGLVAVSRRKRYLR